MICVVEWLCSKLELFGFIVCVDVIFGYLLVYVERLYVFGKFIVLIYGYYDVQFEVLLEEWYILFFELMVCDGCIYVCGSIDDKGQVFVYFKGVELLFLQGELLVNVKFLFEGEEEIGSVSIGDYFIVYKDELKVDVILIFDGSCFVFDVFIIIYGVCGLSYVEIYVQGVNCDLYLGSYGGVVFNFINVLCEIIVGFKDDQGCVIIFGFYDGIELLIDEECQMWVVFFYFDEEFVVSIGVFELFGEEGYIMFECFWGWFMLDVNGIWGGYQGEGFKIVIVVKVGVKVFMWLVLG